MKTSMLFNLDFTNSTILSCFFYFYFFLIIDLYFLTTAVVEQVFNPITELVVPIGILLKELKAEIEIYSVIMKAKIKKCSI